MTKAERRLWRFLRGNQLEGFSFRRQHPVGNYVLDFYCSKLKLAIELDGGQHGEAVHVVRDRERDDWLTSKGIFVIRVWNGEIVSNLEGVWETIRQEALRLAAAPSTPAWAQETFPSKRVSAVSTSRGSTPTPALPLSGGGGMEVDR